MCSVTSLDISERTSCASTKKYDFLSSLVEFSEVSAADLKALASESRFENLESGECLLTEGEEYRSYGFIVVSGRLAMLKASANGKELIVELLQSGDTFGLLSKLTREKLPFELSAKTLQSSKVLWVPTSSFLSLLGKYPELFSEFMAHTLLCLQSAYNLARGLAHDKVEVRIASILVSLALKFARPLRDDRARTIYFTRQQLADLTGTTPETAIRVTRSMEKDGLIELSRPGIIKVLDLEAIRNLVEA